MIVLIFYQISFKNNLCMCEYWVIIKWLYTFLLLVHYVSQSFLFVINCFNNSCSGMASQNLYRLRWTRAKTVQTHDPLLIVSMSFLLNNACKTCRSSPTVIILSVTQVSYSCLGHESHNIIRDMSVIILSGIWVS